MINTRSDMRARAGGLLFALLLNGLLVLALLTLAPHVDQVKIDPRWPVTFDMAGPPEPEKAKGEEAEKAEEAPQEEAEPEEVQERPEPPQPERPVEAVKPPIVKLPSPLPAPLPFLQLDAPQMAAADIGKLPRRESGEGAAGQGKSAAVAGPGEGPGGVQLFEAEWHRRPTPAELASYVPGNAPAQGWGLVACKTVDNYHVDNCQALGESPVGSGFARAVRLAAWQFLVRPPRINGKPQVGSWVRIRIDYSRSVATGRDAG